MMKLNPIAPNQTELTLPSGVTILFSYKTPVAAFVPGKGILASKEKYSVTTSKHVNAWIGKQGATRTNVDQSEIDALLT